jgi:sterol desaturase/sphingolipid hydroxylase (fatty acid hydroxylase superfamily)
MSEILLAVESLGNGSKLLWIVLWISVFSLVEKVMPFNESVFDKIKHSKINFTLLGSTIIINALFGIITGAVVLWQSKTNIGLLKMIDLPIFVELIIAILLLDLIAQYFVHYLLHHVKFMWKFHLVHHSDTMVDVTTGTRHHPGDYIMRETFSLVAIIICGMPFSYYMLYRLLTIFFTYFSHANIQLNSKLENVLSLIFITPSLHKFHHHFERPWTDKNYGNIFSIWDRIFGTLVQADENKIIYGVDVLDSEKSNNLRYQLAIPFDKSIKTDY